MNSTANPRDRLFITGSILMALVAAACVLYEANAIGLVSFMLLLPHGCDRVLMDLPFDLMPGAMFTATWLPIWAMVSSRHTGKRVRRSWTVTQITVQALTLIPLGLLTGFAAALALDDIGLIPVPASGGIILALPMTPLITWIVASRILWCSAKAGTLTSARGFRVGLTAAFVTVAGPAVAMVALSHDCFARAISLTA